MGKVYKRYVELNDKYLKDADAALASKDFFRRQRRFGGQLLGRSKLLPRRGV